MAGKSAVLKIEIVGDASKAQSAIGKAQSSVEGMQKGMDKVAPAMAAAGAGLVAYSKQAYDAAAALEQSQGSVEAVFGAGAKQIDKFSSNAARAVGLSKNSYNELASVLGSQLKNAGVPMDQIAGKTNTLITQGADMAAVFGGSVGDAVGALSSALKGETDPIERYGISLNDATLKAQAQSMGLGDLYAKQDRGAKLAATLAAVNQQAASTQGQWNAQIGTAGEQTQLAAAQWEDASAKLGEVLLPVVTWATDKIGKFSQWLTDNSETVQFWGGVLAGLIGTFFAVRGALSVVETGMKAAEFAGKLFGGQMTALSLNPWMLGLMALVGVIALIMANWDKVSGAAKAAGEWIGKFTSSAGDALGKFFTWLGNAVKRLFDMTPLGMLFNLLQGKNPFAAFTSGGVDGAQAASMPMSATFAYQAADAATGQQTFAAGTVSPSGGVAGRLGGLFGNTYQINISGALDPDAVGRQIDDIMRRYGRTRGRIRVNA